MVRGTTWPSDEVDLLRLLAPDGALGLEIDPSQAGEVAELVGRTLPGAEVAVLDDLAGLPRHVVARMAGVASRRAGHTRPSRD